MTFQITGSHGTLVVYADSGRIDVANCTYDTDAYREIIRIDVGESQAHYEKPVSACEDILDFGYWTDTGFYEPPAVSWRQHYRERYGVPARTE
jgi:hypothetical protein